MWITEAEDKQYYKTREERPGVVYLTTLSVSKQDDKIHLVMDFKAGIPSVGIKIMAGIMGIFFNKATKDAIKQDLKDLKAIAEGK